jgi:hypothetical protein
VVIDDPRSDHQASGIQNSFRVTAYLSDLDDTPAADSDVAVEAGYAGTVNNLSVPDDQVVLHCSSCAASELHAPAPRLPSPACR